MPDRLEANLGLSAVFSVSIGAMIGSGIFVLPGLAAKIAGPAVVFAYILAGVIVMPAALSKAEMATAMPEAGGTYLYIDRAMGPLMGTIAGFGVWFSMIFKSAFALVGLGAYLRLFEHLPERPVALGLGLVIVLINIAGAKTTARFQSILVAVVLAVLAVFVFRGAPAIDSSRFTPLLTHGIKGLLGAAGLVFVSFIGVTKVSSIAEEVKRPERNIPIGMIASIGLVIVLYPLIVGVMVGVTGVDALSRTVTPVSTAAAQFMGSIGFDVVTGIAILSLITMANAGVLAASRFPFAMARHALAPSQLAHISRRTGTPSYAIAVTGALLLLLIAFVPLIELAKLASAFQLIVFALVNLAVIAFRESRLDWYQPAFRSPLYPWTQLGGIAGSLLLLTQMGIVPTVGAAVIVVGGFLWYRAFGRSRASRESASLDALRLRNMERLVGLTREALANPGAGHILALTWPGMKRDRLREILQLAADLTRTEGKIDVSRVDRRGRGEDRAEQAWAAEIRTTAADLGITLNDVLPSAIREDHQQRIEDQGVDFLLAEMPQEIRANRAFIRDLRWLRDNAECDTVFVRNRGFSEISQIVIMGSGGPFDVLKISLADRIAQRELAGIRFVHVVNEDATEAQLSSIREYHECLHEMIGAPTESRVERAEDLLNTLARLSRGANLVVLGSVAKRFRIFTDLANRIASMVDAPTLIVYANSSSKSSLLTRIIERLIY